MLSLELRDQFVAALVDIPVTDTFHGRSNLLDGLPSAGLTRAETNKILDLRQLIAQLDKLGRDKRTGKRPLLILAQNALSFVDRWEGDLYTALQVVISDLEHYYGGEAAPPIVPHVEPEALVFKGRDERVPFTFIERALLTSKSIGRLRVPRILAGKYDSGDDIFGTGWLIASGILITNYHVIEARNRSFEPPATLADVQSQAERLTIWFDYHTESGNPFECQGAEFLTGNRKLDYALVRLKHADKISDRKPLLLIERQPELKRGDRLNIVQHSRGGPLIYAIRNNFYVGYGDNKDFMRYLTDTEPGSSGSPILNDFWQIVGLHHAASQIPPEYYASLPQERYLTLPEETAKGEIITYHNEGIAIHSILNDLPLELRMEITCTQG